MNAKILKTSFSKRLLCIVMFLVMMLNFAAQYVLPVLSVDKDPYITKDGQRINELFLSDGEKVNIEAVFEGELILRYGWQIRYSASPERWINISMANGSSLAVSCAMIASLADDNGKAVIRCALYGDKVYYTAPLEIYMTGVPYIIEPVKADGKAAPAPVEEEGLLREYVAEAAETVAETTAISEETMAVPEETTAVPEETTAAPEETTAAPEETTAAPEETTAAPEETTAAPKETTAGPEETTAIPEETTAVLEEITTIPEETNKLPEEITPPSNNVLSSPEESPVAEGDPADSAENESEEEPEETTDKFGTHSIVINYLFDNNIIAFEPYGASVAHNSSFNEIVPSPDVIGYLPYRRLGEDYVEAPNVEFNIDHVTEDITINIIYEPTLVNFTVHHYLQNLHNDEYTLDSENIQVIKGLTASIVPADLALNETQLPGFKALSYERLEIAADGSTIVEIRYDRNYYLVDFDMSGGYGTEPIYTRFGDTVGANIPIRHGYVFDGWNLVSYDGHTPTGSQQAEFALTAGTTITVPAASLKYSARWITTQTTYTMVFWKENADDGDYTYWGHLEGMNALSGTLVDGRDIVSQVAGIEDEQYFTFNKEKTEKGILVEGDGSTVVNVYYTRNYYKLTIKAKGLCAILENHIHDDKCYDFVCGLGHTHTAECMPELSCNIQEHEEHTPECLTCTVGEHTHSTACSCLLREHTHTKSCWRNIGTAQNNTPNGAPETAEDGYVFRKTSNSTRYIYIKGTWYRYNGLASANTIVDPTCGYDEEHSHGDECACKITEHTHGLACYRDVIHLHTENCYVYHCGAIGHEHVDACKRLKCGITENHKHNNTCKNSGSTNTVKEIYRKYDQSIKDIWPITDGNGVVYDNGERWSPSDSSYYKNVLVYLPVMTPDHFTLTLNTATYVPYTMQYYMEMLPDDTAPAGSTVVTLDGKRYLLDNTIKAKYNYVTKAEDFFDIVGFDQYKSNPNFSNNQISISGNEAARVVKFYYNRKTDHYLRFNNNGELLDAKEKYGIMFGAKLDAYNFVPEYPSKLEPNAYTFAGWYTSPGCYDGTEVDWNTITMPEGDLLLYAKWAPIKHKVNVYLDYTLEEKVCEEQTVDHGAFAKAPEGGVTNGNYVFQGWFYIDVVNGEEIEKAFTFNGIPVKDDMNIYAKWGSHVSVNYKVNYVLKETGEPVADPTEGSAIAGNNKTFEAKAGNDLYEKFRTGYYPVVNSHTITMSVEGNLEFTFEYVYVPAMPYKVRYVNAESGEELITEKIVPNNSLSVVTETFEKVDKMMPDAYQKRLVLSASDTDSDGDGVFDSNVITFYYSYDEVHAYYKVVHYIQNIHTDDYREYRSVETVGVIGQTYTVDSLEIIGFYFNGELTKIDGENVPTTGTQVTAKLDDGGLLIEIYYDRLKYKYNVVYKDGKSGEPIVPSKEEYAYFGEQVTENAVDLREKGYTLSSEKVKVLNVSANETHNVIEFLYLESTVSIKYHTVGYTDGGALSRTSENVSAVTGMPLGSTPLIPEGYLFVGWYADADCTLEADPSIVDQETLKLTPVKEEGKVWGDNVEFFAKFIPKETKLTVMKSGWDSYDAGQVFMFRLKGVADTETADIDLTFSIKGDGTAVIAGLPLGEYTVTELVDWSWRYDTTESEKRITLVVDQTQNTVTFTNYRADFGWLDGNADSKNIFS